MNFKKLAKVFLLIYSLILIIGCEEKITEYVEKETLRGHIQLSSKEVEIGQKITANFVNMDSIYIYDVSLNKKEVTFSQINDSTVTLIVPYTEVGSDVGNFIFYCWMLTKSSVPDSVLVSSQINYIYEGSVFNPIVNWNSNENINEIDSRISGGFGEYFYWTMQIQNDTVKFIRHIVCHDECSIDEIIAFKSNGNDTLPELLYAKYSKNEWIVEPINEEITTKCKVIIDKWNDNGIYSGTFTTSKYSWVFWGKE